MLGVTICTKVSDTVVSSAFTGTVKARIPGFASGLLLARYTGPCFTRCQYPSSRSLFARKQQYYRSPVDCLRPGTSTPCIASVSFFGEATHG